MRLYFLNQFVETGVPCEPTLDGWARWLSLPRSATDRAEDVKDGENFSAAVLRMEKDIVVRRTNAGWVFSRSPDDAGFLAVRFTREASWHAENVVVGSNMSAALIKWLSDNDDLLEDEELVAVGHPEPNVVLTYRATPEPQLIIEAEVR